MSGNPLDCTCPLSETKDVSCSECLEYTLQLSQHCCVFCDEGGIDPSLTCQTQSDAGSDVCPSAILKCQASDPKIWITVVMVVFCFFLVLVLIMTRNQWIPRMKNNLRNCQRFILCRPKQETTRKFPGSSRNSTSFTSLDNLMSLAPRGSTPNGESNQPIIIDLDDIAKLQHAINRNSDTSESTPSNQDIVYADAVIVDDHALRSEDEYHANDDWDVMDAKAIVNDGSV